MMARAVNVSGTRKKAVARATLKEGKGKVRINNTDLSKFSNALARAKINEALTLAGTIHSKVDISINVFGGGWQAQADAIRLAIARGLVEFSKDKKLKDTYLEYDRHLLVADVRRNEPHKPNNSKPRAKRQKSYR